MAKGRAAAAGAKKLIGLIGKAIRPGTIRLAKETSANTSRALPATPTRRAIGSNTSTVRRDAYPRGSVDRSQVRHVEQHELDSTNRLAKHGYHVEFIPTRKDVRTPDINLNGRPFEMKSPIGGPSSVPRNLRKGRAQSGNLVIDTTRSQVSADDAVGLAADAMRRYPELTEVWILSETTLRKLVR